MPSTQSLAAILLSLALPSAALADPRVDLHVGTAHQECYFDLHPELTTAQFREFAGEAGQLARFRQLSGADTLGTGIFDVNLDYAYFFIDDTKGAWNNTMSHPTAEHYLGEQLGIPELGLRLGVSERVDTEIFGTLNWKSNYGIVGAASKVRLLRQGDDFPLSLSLRPSVAALLGPSEVQVVTMSVDVAASYTSHGFTPFVGGTLSSSVAIDASSDTNVGNQVAYRGLAFAGVEYRFRALNVAAAAEIADVFALALRVGGTF